VSVAVTGQPADRMRGEDVGGIAVHLAARIMAMAAKGEILVSRTVRDLVVGSDLSFEDRGIHRLKGIDGEWQLLAVQLVSPRPRGRAFGRP
jgi:class 3 adenylate cyclase